VAGDPRRRGMEEPSVGGHRGSRGRGRSSRSRGGGRGGGGRRGCWVAYGELKKGIKNNQDIPRATEMAAESPSAAASMAMRPAHTSDTV
jgi:hypothetical protein